ncbi:MAG: hypothetical protein PVS3B1_19270 [Ktedonobacteraceae bacterium]
MKGQDIMLLQHFDPPANLHDFDSIPHQRTAWSEFLSNTFDANIKAVADKLTPGKSQFYNPMRINTDEPHNEAIISWIGFPALISRKHAGDLHGARQEADALLPNGERPQDEYLEWFVTRQGNKIIRVTFTCEGPEYWEALAHGYPLDYSGPRTMGATGDKQKVLALYREFVSPNVQLSDLFQNNLYNKLNKWNTTLGAMHLNQRNNTLGAEINIAAFATILRKRNGQLLTDADDLIRCAKYGEPGRASDPTIGADVNAFARDGYSITLRNPVGLYIDGLNTDGFTRPDGTPITQDYWKIVRGTQDMGVRAVFEVPPQESLTVSDILIGGEAIEFGGQIAEHITMKLTGVACRKGQIHDTAQGCEGAGAAFLSIASTATISTDIASLASRTAQ